MKKLLFGSLCLATVIGLTYKIGKSEKKKKVLKIDKNENQPELIESEKSILEPANSSTPEEMMAELEKLSHQEKN